METISRATLHVAVDMQRLFAESTAWHTPALDAIVPQVLATTRHQPHRTRFARFVTPARPEEAQGQWRRYYERWTSVTTDQMDPLLFDLVAPLAAIVEPGATFDKTTFSIFGNPDFATALVHENIDTLVLTGVETDVCVLASLYDAIDRGYRVVIPVDAVASSAAAAHHAVLEHLLPRLTEQVDLIDTRSLLAAWPCP